MFIHDAWRFNSTLLSTQGDECARAQVVMGNKRKWLISQLCKSVDLMKRDLLVVSLAAHDARKCLILTRGFGTYPL